jgi:hypothetical protein
MSNQEDEMINRMMSRRLRLLSRRPLAMIGLMALTLISLDALPVHAQSRTARSGRTGYRNTLSRPTVSPYLNLTRGGNPAINYFTLARPPIDLRAQQFRQQQATQGLQREVETGVRASELPPTGHSASYMNYSHYYPGLTGRGPAGGRGQ